MVYIYCLLFIICASQATQVPLVSPPDRAGDDWNLNSLPNPDDTSNLIFHTVSSLLQQLPNVRYRNGHAIVPGTVPIGTILYHGRFENNKIPDGPEWTATDPEHSLQFSTEGWLASLVVTRPLKVIYFDGGSAAKMDTGPMDTQDIVAWGELRPESYFKEDDRIIALCDWSKRHGIDGIVRMEMDFEIMICDFKSGLEVVSIVKVHQQSTTQVTPSSDSSDSDVLTDPSLYTPYDDLSPNLPYNKSRIHEVPGAVEVLVAGSRHNHYPGEKRVKLDLSRLLTFYDTSLAPSLVSQRHGQERWDHRLQNISNSDIHAALERLAKYSQTPPSTSGVDWDGLIQIIMDRYSGGLQLIDHLLSAESDFIEDTIDRVGKIHVQLHSILHPYLLVRSSQDSNWASSMLRACSTTHTQYLTSPSIATSLTESEKLILSAVRGTTKEICRVLIGMYVDSVEAGFGEADQRDHEVSYPQEHRAEELIHEWKHQTKSLMSWLDWNEWVYCKPACNPEEMCYLPTWPFWNRSAPERVPDGPNPKIWWREENWLRPEPRCVRRVELYSI